MNTLAKNSLVQAAALAAVWVLASSFAGQTATAKDETRHPDLAISQAFDTLEQAGQYSPARHEAGPGKGDLLIQSDACSNQAWPYISAACVTGLNPARTVSRTITIEKRTGEASSILVRTAAAPKIAAR